MSLVSFQGSCLTLQVRQKPGEPEGALPLLKVVGTCHWTGYDFHGHQYWHRVSLNRPNWLLAGYSVYHRVASQGFPAGFPAHNVYDRPAISAPATTRTVRAGRPRVNDRPADAISAPIAVRAGRPAGRNRFRVFHFFLL